MKFKWRIKKIDNDGQIYYMPQWKGWIFWNNVTWDEYCKVYYKEAEHYFSTCDQLKIPGLLESVDYVGFFNLEDAKRLIVGIEKLETNKKKHKKELNEYIYIGDDSILNELKK